ncbi:coniferyl aldehyde dehydrogenase [Pseudenhygromyxa sp. WMMC2535]|uniref:aldehyde dehydrogenase family protein n=1 Tax=Pseudenhygromyxa sp. WMMC2535 TaxID=2712867 RepID=UPI0015529C1E|nr:coniferyl aldehyde dehydrogenase [Pseudenhygromyxa sp. WMMC2535]
MRATLERQRAACMAELPVSAAIRKDRLRRSLNLVLENEDRLVEALSEDYGHRSPIQSQLADIMGTVKPLRQALTEVERWMKPERRKVDLPLWLLGARARVEYQPKGVVGVISPWNFPVFLTFGPLAEIFAAGNRAMVKPSEHTPATAALMRELAEAAFDEDELAVFTGGVEVGKAFSQLPFDHLIFTGSTALGREIQRAAASNLVPTTLELGGKSPAIIGSSANLQRTCDRLVAGKLLNAGQVCLAPDYLLVPAAHERAIIEGLQAAAAAMYPSIHDNPDFCSLINARHRERLRGLVDDARDKGAELTVVNPGGETLDQPGSNKMALHLLREVTSDMRVMQEEIFGPVLPVITYERIDEAIAYINARPRPLGLYYFGEDQAEQTKLLERTIAGGVTINDVIYHGVTNDLPFGGVGESGMGAYHGFDGFRTFSHAKGIYTQPRVDLAKLAGLVPPYGDKSRKSLEMQIGKPER